VSRRSGRSGDRSPSTAQQAWLDAHDYETVDRPGRSTAYCSPGGHRSAWLQGTQGRTVIAQMRRYLETRDSMKIERALYEFLTYRCNFSACFDLGPGDGWFRDEYSEPITLIEEFAQLHRDWWSYGPELTIADVTRYHGVHVYLYTDGLTCHDIVVELVRLMHAHLDRLVQARDEAAHDREMTLLIELARRHKMTLVPAGYLLTDRPLVPPPSREADASLHGELRRLAAELGHDLAEPRAQLALG
jgi:hypothetical protein